MLFSPYYFGEPLFYMDWKPILDKSETIYKAKYAIYASVDICSFSRKVIEDLINKGGNNPQ